MKRIFLGAAESSGTEILGNILNQHPQIYCGPEASLFDRGFSLQTPSSEIVAQMHLDNYRKLDITMPFPIMIQDGMQSYSGLSSWRWESLWPSSEREKIMEGYSEGESFSAADLYDTLMWNESASKGIDCFAERTPGNLFYFGAIKEVWPDSKLIIIMRNPYDTIMHLLFNRHNTLHEAISKWVAGHEAMLRWADQLTADELSIVQYERLGLQMDSIYGFLGVDAVKEGHAVGVETDLWEKYKDAVIPGVVDLIEISCGFLWREFCHNYGIEEVERT